MSRTVDSYAQPSGPSLIISSNLFRGRVKWNERSSKEFREFPGLIISYFYGNSKRSIRERARAFGLRGAFLKEHVARSGDGDYRTKV